MYIRRNLIIRFWENVANISAHSFEFFHFSSFFFLPPFSRFLTFALFRSEIFFFRSEKNILRSVNLFALVRKGGKKRFVTVNVFIVDVVRKIFSWFSLLCFFGQFSSYSLAKLTFVLWRSSVYMASFHVCISLENLQFSDKYGFTVYCFLENFIYFLSTVCGIYTVF